jgi:stage II sporulation protein D
MTAVLVAFLTSILAADPATTLRVGVLSLLHPDRVEIGTRDASIDLPGRGRLAPGERLVVTTTGRGLKATVTGTAWRWSGRMLSIGRQGIDLHIIVRGRDVRERTIDGVLEISPVRGRLRLVSVVGLEETVATATAAEVEGATEVQALEAAAITIRSYLVASRGRHASEGFDVCDTTHCLVSRGSRAPETTSGRAAAEAARQTRGRVLQFGGSVVPGYCSSCCGGSTTTPTALWGTKDSGAFTAVRCDSCAASPYFQWRRRVDDADVRAFSGSTEVVEFSKNRDGYVRYLVVSDGHRRQRVDGERFRLELGRRIGWDAIPSPRFSASRVAGGFELVGGGHGHGIGLCVRGAVAMARRGASRDAILTRYFPKCRVTALW